MTSAQERFIGEFKASLLNPNPLPALTLFNPRCVPIFRSCKYSQTLHTAAKPCKDPIILFLLYFFCIDLSWMGWFVYRKITLLVIIMGISMVGRQGGNVRCLVLEQSFLTIM